MKEKGIVSKKKLDAEELKRHGSNDVCGMRQVSLARETDRENPPPRERDDHFVTFIKESNLSRE